MRKLLKIGIVAVAWASSTLGLRADTVYPVSFVTVFSALVPPSDFGGVPTNVYGLVEGTITTSGANTVNPLTDIVSYSLKWTQAADPAYTSFFNTYTFNSTNSHVASTAAGDLVSSTATLVQCQSGLCLLPTGDLAFRLNAFEYLTISRSSVIWAIPLHDFELATPRLAYDASANGYALMSTPVPAALPLFASGAALIGLMARRRTRQSARV